MAQRIEAQTADADVHRRTALLGVDARFPALRDPLARLDAHASQVSLLGRSPALSAYDPAYAALMHQKMERRAEKLETSTGSDLDYARANMMAFGATEEVPYDKSGRIVLPPMMRLKGKLEDLALFIGNGETFQIWNPKLFLSDKNIPDDMKDIARFRLEERGLKA